MEICLLQNWQIKHLNKIYNTYHKAPFFDLYFPQIAQTIVQSRYIKDLKTLNYQLIHCLMNCLNIKTTLLFSSELPISGLRADEYNAAIVHYLGGNAYISGAGAVKYQTEFTYNNLEIELIYSKLGKFLKTTPPQYPVPFLATLSILDALFYIGENAIIQMFKQYKTANLLIEKNKIQF